MKIVHVIHTKFPVVGYGGTERIAQWLGKAQAEMGHEVTYLCAPGSSLSFAKTIPLPEGCTDLTPLLPPGTDIVQFYGTPGARCEAPFLIVIEGNGQAGESFHPNTVFASENHAKRHGWTEFVHNGLDLSEYPLETKKEKFALFLAKASWRVKNLPGSIRIAKAAGFPLHVAGGKAGCWHRNVVSYGIIDGEQKMKLLKHASALLFPVIWEEPFGIAVIEALACGTPVVATPRGAMPEIITPSSGVIGNSFAELVQGLQRSRDFAPEACRARVEEAFTHRHMAEKYLYYYKKILSDGKLREGFPKAADNADPQQKIYYKDYTATSLKEVRP